MKIPATDPEGAFTAFEALVVGAAGLLLLAVFLPALGRPRSHSSRLNCVNNLKQDGIAFRIWEGDNNDKYPMAVSVTNGGAMERLAAGDVVTCFQVMSNELATPGILVCPDDTEHNRAADFGGGLSRSNLSYFVGRDAAESEPESVMMGDANLVVNGRRVPSGIFTLSTTNFTWAKNRHQYTGNLLIADGSVQSTTSHSAATYLRTNTLVIP